MSGNSICAGGGGIYAHTCAKDFVIWNFHKFSSSQLHANDGRTAEARNDNFSAHSPRVTRPEGKRRLDVESQFRQTAQFFALEETAGVTHEAGFVNFELVAAAAIRDRHHRELNFAAMKDAASDSEAPKLNAYAAARLDLLDSAHAAGTTRDASPTSDALIRTKLRRDSDAGTQSLRFANLKWIS